MIQALRQAGESKNLANLVEEVFESDGYSVRSVLDSDVLNPVDSYNLIKRTARTWPKVENAFNATTDAQKENSFSRHLHSVLQAFPSWEKNREGCALGLLNIQQYYGLAPDKLARGQVEDPASGQQFLASTRLTHLDALLVAQVVTVQIVYPVDHPTHIIMPLYFWPHPGCCRAEVPGRRHCLACGLPRAEQAPLSCLEGTRSPAGKTRAHLERGDPHLPEDDGKLPAGRAAACQNA